jgi:hypothetical protein
MSFLLFRTAHADKVCQVNLCLPLYTIALDPHIKRRKTERNLPILRNFFSEMTPDLGQTLDWGRFFQVDSKGLKHPKNKGGKKPKFWHSFNQRKPI